MRATAHVSKRMQQRSIPRLVVELLLDFGHPSYGHGNAAVYTFDRRAQKRLKAYLGALADTFMGSYGRCYLVADSLSGDIITVGYDLNKKLH